MLHGLLYLLAKQTAYTRAGSVSLHSHPCNLRDPLKSLIPVLTALLSFFDCARAIYSVPTLLFSELLSLSYPHHAELTGNSSIHRLLTKHSTRVKAVALLTRCEKYYVFSSEPKPFLLLEASRIDCCNSLR